MTWSVEGGRVGAASGGGRQDHGVPDKDQGGEGGGNRKSGRGVRERTEDRIEIEIEIKI